MTETKEPTRPKPRPNIPSLNKRYQYRDLKVLVSIDEIYTETNDNDTQSQASRPILKWGSKDKTKPNSETKNKYKGENLSN